MSPDRPDDRYPPVDKVLTEVLHLPDPGPDMIVVDAFGDSDRHGFHVASGEATVGVQSLVNNDQVFQQYILLETIRMRQKNHQG